MIEFHSNMLSEGEVGSIFSNYKKLIRIKKWFMIEFHSNIIV